MEGLIATLIEFSSRKLQTLHDALLATFRLVNGWDRSHSNSHRIHMFTVWCRAADCPWTTNGGSDRLRAFFCRVRVLSRVFRGKFVAGLKRAFPGTSSPSMALPSASGQDHIREVSA